MDKEILAYKGVKLLLVRLTVLTGLQSIAIVVQAYFLSESISSLFRGDLFRTVIFSLFIFFAALICRKLIMVRKDNIAFHFAAKTSKELRKSLLTLLFQLGPNFVRSEGTGQTVTLVLEGISKFRRFLELLFVKFINSLLIPAVVLLCIFMEDFRSGFILIITMPILIVFLILLGQAAKSKADRQFEAYRLLSNHFVDSLRGLETLKYLGLSKTHLKNITSVSEQYRRTTMGTLRIAFLSTFALDFFTMLSIATVAVFLGMALMKGTMDLHSALAILILAPEFFLPIRELGTDYHATLDGKNAGKKLREILAKDMKQQEIAAIPEWTSNSSLTINGLNVRFDNHERASLEEIHFSVSGFKKIGIIGHSGAGKSTLIDVLSGFIPPTSGEFHLNNQAISTLSYQDWQRQVTYIPQHPYLFHDTVLNNIRFYQPDASLEEVAAVMKLTGLHEVVESLPQGVNTLIGEGGRRLSGGQEQRIAIARAFLGKRPILMLDEPTAHLDIETEAEIKELMLKLFNDKLVFIATHRLHWMQAMDHIIVLNNGKLVESGTHEELWKKRSFYYDLVNFQKGKE